MRNYLIINGCKLVMTCGTCPEQYDVFFGKMQLGYLRLRHGVFRADLYNCGGDTVYHGYPKGYGVFHEDERMFFLKEAVDSLIAAHNAKVLDDLYTEM